MAIIHTLTLTLQPDCKAVLGITGTRAQSTRYQAEVLNFETPGVFFGKLIDRAALSDDPCSTDGWMQGRQAPSGTQCRAHLNTEPLLPLRT